MTPRAAASDAHARTGIGRLVLCLATLTALFAMHGPSSDHMLEMPVRDGAMTVMTLGNAAHEPDQLGVLLGVGKRSSAVELTTYARSAAAPQPQAAGMSHTQCLATLRAVPHLLALLATSALFADLYGARYPSRVGATRRAPPRPSLDKLGISRT